MYIPGYTKHEDEADLLKLMQEHPFATLVTAPSGRPFATHLPLITEKQGDTFVLLSHMARANPQWQHFSEGETLAIFHGPHALINSGLYGSSPNVPTWNYTVVHAYGQASIITGERERETAYKLVAEHTPDMEPIPPDFERRLMAAVVTFELRVTRLEGKYKLSQNKDARDRAKVIEGLSQSKREEERATAELMRELESHKS